MKIKGLPLSIRVVPDFKMEKQVTLVVACMDLLWIPIGTIIGIYELWVLLQDETTQLFKTS